MITRQQPPPTPAPLPPNVQRAAQQLRQLTPSQDFAQQLKIALNEIDEEQRCLDPKPAPKPQAPSRSIWSVPTTVITLLLVGSTSMWMAEHIPLPRADKLATIDHQHELEVEHPGQELIWMDVDLMMHHHNGDQPILRVEAPPQLTIQHGKSTSHDHDAQCDEHKCIHTLPAQTQQSSQIKIGVPHEGHWQLQVSHQSQAAHINEAITIRAH